MSGRGILTFAQAGGYVLDKNDSLQYPGIPENLKKEFSSEENKKGGVTVRTISVGEEGDFFCAWVDGNKKSWRWTELHNYPVLKEWIENEDNKKKFVDEGWSCSLGPGGSHYCNNSGAGQSRNNLDMVLHKDITARLQDGMYVGDPVSVALGVGGSYVLVGKKGDLTWDLKGHYQDLDKRLKEATQPVKTITLSIFNPNYYYLLWQDGSSAWWGNPAWDFKLTA